MHEANEVYYCTSAPGCQRTEGAAMDTLKDGTYQVRDLPLTNSIAITMPILGNIWFCRMLNQVLEIATVVFFSNAHECAYHCIRRKRFIVQEVVSSQLDFTWWLHFWNYIQEALFPVWNTILQLNCYRCWSVVWDNNSHSQEELYTGLWDRFVAYVNFFLVDLLCIYSQKQEE
jgi:hypothetical protein